MRRHIRPAAWLACVVLLALSTGSRSPDGQKPSLVSNARGQETSSEKASAKQTDVLTLSELPAGRSTQGVGVILGHNEDDEGLGGATLWGYSDQLGKSSKVTIPKPESSPVPVVGIGFGIYLVDGQLFGYSAKTGEWSAPNVPEGVKIRTVRVAGSVGCAYADDRIYGYSPTTDHWGQLKTKSKPQLDGSKIVVEDGGQTYLFSDAAGRWSSTAEGGDATKAGTGQPSLFSDVTAPKALVTSPGTPGKSGPMPGMPGMRGGMPGRMGSSGMPGMSSMAGMSGMPGMSGSGMAPPASKGYIQGKNVGLMQNEERDKLWGYSVPLGKWTGLSIPKTEKRLSPKVSFDVGAFGTGGRVYAFSSKTGRWDVLKTKAIFNVQPEQIVVDDGGKIYIFSNVTGRWSSSDDPNDDVIRRSSDDPLSDVIREETGARSLFDDRGRRIVLGTIDRNGELDVLVPETSERISAADLLESLKARSADAERSLGQIAAECRQTRERSGETAPVTVALKSRLTAAVMEAFERRQQAQRLEAEVLRVKLQRVDSRLLERENSKEGIVSRRVNELLDGPEPVAPEPPAKNDAPAESRRPARAGARRGGSSTGETYPSYVPRGLATRTVGVVSAVDEVGNVLLSPEEVNGIHIGDELEVSRPDFVHEDGTQQYYSFARLFVVQAKPDSASARIIEIARTRLHNKSVQETIAPGQIVGIAIEKPGTRPEAGNPELAPLQGRWRLNRWVDEGRVMPPGDLKGSRHQLFVKDDVLTFFDPSAGEILDRLQIETLDTHPDVKGVAFQMQRARFGSGHGVYRLDGQTLRIGLQTGPGWNLELEPGAGLIFWEFTRDSAAVGDDQPK
ncbi:MAG TPA: hypothetical protein VGM05_12400 [Planctomycetaceae bacterium]